MTVSYSGFEFVESDNTIRVKNLIYEKMSDIKAVVRRKWGNREIDTFIRIDKGQDGEVEISLDMADFLHALKQEIGSITFTLTKNQFSEKLDTAVKAVIQSMKTATRNESKHIPYDR